MQSLKDIISKSERYSDFTLLDTPIEFCVLYENQDIKCIQLHSTQRYKYDDTEDIVGFCGTCAWNNNEIISLDGDSYTKHMTVVGYSWFKDKNNDDCLDILVDDW